MIDPGQLAAVGGALYVAHHIGDYWVQTDAQAGCKGKAGPEGRWACLGHCYTYVLTQAVALVTLEWITSVNVTWYALLAALALSGLAHYAADRREHSLMFWLARKLGKGPFMKLGVPREPRVIEAWFDCASCSGRGTGGQAADESTNGMCWDCRGGGKLPSALAITDAPQLATGAWALDQSWHLVTSVAIPAVILLALS